MPERNIEDASSWLLLPPGNLAILRFPANAIPAGAQLATHFELLAANLGRPFPWGDLPTDERACELWKVHRIGVGGLIHERWFMTSGGRFGGAKNVETDKTDDSLRCYMYLHGGKYNERLKENEGFAVVKKVAEENQQLYREVQFWAAGHAVADGGGVIVCPMNDKQEASVGFAGHCQDCPNFKRISLGSLRKAVPGYHLTLLPEWENLKV